MKKTAVFILIVILCNMSWVFAQEDIDLQMETAGVGEIDRAAEAAREFEPDFNFQEQVKKNVAGEASEESGTGLLYKILSLFLDSLKSGMSEMAKIMLAVLIFGIILRFIPEGTASEAAFYATYAVLFAMALFVFEKAATVGAEVIDEMNFFVKAAVPVMCSLAVPGGKFLSSAQTAGIIAGICVVTETAARVLLPLTSMMAALSAANNLSNDMTLKGLERLIKRVIMWCIGITMTVFVSLLKIRGLTGSSLDNVAGKTVRFAVGNMVPVVGGIISDSLENIISYSRAIQTGCGAVGIIALIYMIIPPVMQIAGMLVAFRITGIVTSPVTDSRINGAIDNFSDILGLVLIITVVVCILFITAMGSLAA